MMQLPKVSTITIGAYSPRAVAGFQIACILVLFGYSYSETVIWLWHYWIKEQNWQFLVPVAFVYMLWDRRDELILALKKRSPNIPGGAALLSVACAILVAGQISSTQNLRETSIVLSIFALVLLLFGTNYVQKLFWPLAYLTLMTSLPSDLLEELRYPLKLLAATVAADVLSYAGYAVFRDGAFLQLPHIVLEVRDTCSGLNQLISAIAMGIPIAYMVLNQWWKRLFVIVVSLVFALIMNWIRVILISVWHYQSAKVSVHGPYGIYELPFIFLIGIALTFIVAKAISDSRVVRQQGTPQVVSGNAAGGACRRRYTVAFLSGMLILSTTGFSLHSWKSEPVYLGERLSSFPLEIAGFQGKPIDALDRPFHTGVAHDEIILEYHNYAGVTATVYLGYFHAQNQEEELIDYRYNWLHDNAEAVDFPASPSPVQMKMSTVKTRAGTATVYFCYDVSGRNLIDPKKVKFASLMDALTSRRTNGAIIIIALHGSQDARSSDEREFIKRSVAEAQARIRSASHTKQSRTL